MTLDSNIVTAKQYRQMALHTCEAPSGAVFLVGEPSDTGLLRIFLKEGMSLDDLSDEKKVGKALGDLKVDLADLLETVICDGVRSPRIVRGEAQGEDELSFNDLKRADREFLWKEIMETLGLTRKAAEERDSFRKIPARGSGGPSRPEIRAEAK